MTRKLYLHHNLAATFARRVSKCESPDNECLHVIGMCFLDVIVERLLCCSHEFAPRTWLVLPGGMFICDMCLERSVFRRRIRTAWALVKRFFHTFSVTHGYDLFAQFYVLLTGMLCVKLTLASVTCKLPGASMASNMFP